METYIRRSLRTSARCPALPALSQAQIAHRWRLDADTVRKILKSAVLPTEPGPWKHPRYSLRDLLRIEGAPEQDILDEAKSSALAAPLIDACTVAELWNCTPATVRNWSSQKAIPSIRLGGSLRFHHYRLFPDKEIEGESTDPRKRDRT